MAEWISRLFRPVSHEGEHEQLRRIRKAVVQEVEDRKLNLEQVIEQLAREKAGVRSGE